jgi:hypothetical protein
VSEISQVCLRRTVLWPHQLIAPTETFVFAHLVEFSGHLPVSQSCFQTRVALPLSRSTGFWMFGHPHRRREPILSCFDFPLVGSGASAECLGSECLKYDDCAFHHQRMPPSVLVQAEGCSSAAREDGQRPTCDRCFRNGTSCHYDAAIGESRSSTLRKRCVALEKEVIQLRKENQHLKHVCGCIGVSPNEEACEGSQQFRQSGSGNPIDTMQSSDHDESLTEEYTASPRLNEMSDETGVATASTLFIKVPALPWSVVAGDQIVSECHISSLP